MPQVVCQDAQLQREYLLRSFLENSLQFRHSHPSDIPYFVMLGDGFSIFDLAHKDKAHP